MQVTIKAAEAITRLSAIKSKLELKKLPFLVAEKKAKAAAITYRKAAYADAIKALQHELAAITAGKPVLRSQSRISEGHGGRTVNKKKYSGTLIIDVPQRPEHLDPEKWNRDYAKEKINNHLREINEALDVLAISDGTTVTVDTEVGWGRLLSYGK